MAFAVSVTQNLPFLNFIDRVLIGVSETSLMVGRCRFNAFLVLLEE